MKKNILNIPNLSLRQDNVFFYLGVQVDTLHIYQDPRSVSIRLCYLWDITKAIEIAEKLNCTVTHYDKTDSNGERYIIDANFWLEDGRWVSIGLQGYGNDGYIYDLEYARKIQQALTVEA